MFNPILNLSALNGTDGFSLNGVASFDRTGNYVSGAGDINGDGIEDLLIGAVNADPNGDGSGRSYVVFGTSSGFGASLNLGSLNGTNGFAINGEAAGDRTGIVTGLGDVNGDGIDDIGISGRISNIGYVLFGQSSGFGVSLNLSSLNGTNGFRVGGGIRGAGDMNGDGIDDLSIQVGENSHVVFGKAPGFGTTLDLTNLNGTNGFTISGSTPLTSSNATGQFDSGDFNGDGFDDLIKGNAIIFGKRNGFTPSLSLTALDGTNGFSITTATGFFNRFGLAVSSAGDINGDGIDDLIAGDPEAGEASSKIGQSYVIFGSRAGFSSTFNLSTLNGANGFRIDGILTRDYSGRFVSGAGDLNGDGFDDLVIGSDFADPNGSFSGQTYVVFGKSSGFGATFPLSSLNGTNGFVVNGIATRDYSGVSTAAGDINGDGVDDLIIGAYGADPNGIAGAGQGYVIFGRGAAIAGLTLRSPLVDARAVAGSITANLEDEKLRIHTAISAGRTIKNYLNVQGTALDDQLIGSRANNLLVGNSGKDLIEGGAGDDTLSGGRGVDTLTGGEGRDRFVFDTGSRFTSRSIGKDTITDFLKGQDKIVIDRTTFQGVRKVSFAGVKTIAHAKTNTAQFTYVRRTGALFFNQNGVKGGFGSGGQFADFANGLNLLAKDFAVQP
jgi:Ca2+-binding RTX toxin-like protein